MKQAHIPEPSVMPIDREQWAGELHLSNFINTYYQFRDLQTLKDVHSVLIIGPGQGLDTHVLKWRRYDITTFDIDHTFKPDVVGSVHDLSAFKNDQFDAVIASHVLEHVAVPLLDPALKEIARVGSYALIYLPLRGVHLRFRFSSNFRGWDLNAVFRVFNFFEKPNGITPRYMGGQHFWEVGTRGFRRRDLKKRMSQFFDVLSMYENKDWLGSYNFVLRSKRAQASVANNGR